MSLVCTKCKKRQGKIFDDGFWYCDECYFGEGGVHDCRVSRKNEIDDLVFWSGIL